MDGTKTDLCDILCQDYPSDNGHGPAHKRPQIVYPENLQPAQAEGFGCQGWKNAATEFVGQVLAEKKSEATEVPGVAVFGFPGTSI